LSKGERKGRGIHTYYRIEGDKLERRIPFCNRCGKGYFMADHGNRYACGRCGFTVFKSRKERER